jgi:hypothetical protein
MPERDHTVSVDYIAHIDFPIIFGVIPTGHMNIPNNFDPVLVRTIARK